MNVLGNVRKNEHLPGPEKRLKTVIFGHTNVYAWARQGESSHGPGDGRSFDSPLPDLECPKTFV
jgi:hypothetical protein